MVGKRRKTSGGSVTGGTGDIKPQYIVATVSAPTGAADYSIVQINVPRIVLGEPDMATIMEILSVEWYPGLNDLGDNVSLHGGFLDTRASRLQDEAATLATIATDAGSPTVFAWVMIDHRITTSGGATSEYPLTVNTNDGNGNGILIASDRFFAIGFSVANTVPADHVVRIMYRLVNVGITEYVGIVAAQS